MEPVSPTHTRGWYTQPWKSTPRPHCVRVWQCVMALVCTQWTLAVGFFLWSLGRWMNVVDASCWRFWRVGFILCIKIFVSSPRLRWSNKLEAILHTEEFINDCNLTRTNDHRDWQGDSRLGMTTSRLSRPISWWNIGHWMGLMEDSYNQLNRVGVNMVCRKSVSMPWVIQSNKWN